MPDLHHKAQSCLLLASDTKLAGLGVEARCLLKLMLVLILTWMITIVALSADVDDRCNCSVQAGCASAVMLCRADWKACQVDRPAEQARTEDFKALFQPYDVVNS